MPKRVKYPKIDFRALDTSGVLATKYSPEGRAQIRRLTVGKPTRKKGRR